MDHGRGIPATAGGRRFRLRVASRRSGRDDAAEARELDSATAHRPRCRSALPQFDLRAADVAGISRPRWEGMDREVDFCGAPDLVIENIWPSNTQSQRRATVS